MKISMNGGEQKTLEEMKKEVAYHINYHTDKLKDYEAKLQILNKINEE